MLALLGLTAAVWLVHLYGRVLPTTALAAAWAALTALMTLGLLRRARVRRAAFLASYFRTSSPLARRLRGGVVMLAREALVSAALALLLIVAIVRLREPEAWIVLVSAAPVVVLLRGLLGRALAPHVSEAYLPELAWRVTLAVVGALMLTSLVLLAFQRSYPELGGVSLERAVWHFVDQERSRSAAAEVLLQMAAAKDALRLWLAQQLVPEPGVSLAQGLGWVIVLAEEALFVWSYLSLCSAALLGSRSR